MVQSLSILPGRGGRRAGVRTLLLILLVWCNAPALAAQPSLPLRATEALTLDVVSLDGREVVCGDYGQILYRDTTLEAAAWRLANVPVDTLLTALYFIDSRRGWAVGHDGVILATIDGGANWVLQRNGLQSQQILNESQRVAVSAQLAATRAALLGADSEASRRDLLLRLEDLEMDLEDAEALLEAPVHAPPLLDVYFSDALHGVATGAFNTLLFTSDGGVSWQQYDSALENPDEFHLNAVTGNGNGDLWIAAEAGLMFHSTDFGRSWRTLASPYDGSWFGILHQPGGSTLLAFGLRGNVYRSVDGGDSWQAVEGIAPRTLAGGVFAGPSHVLLVGAVGTLLASSDGGNSFIEIELAERVGLSGAAVSAGQLLLVGRGGIYRVESPFGVRHD